MATPLTKPLQRVLEREGLVVKFTPEGVYTRQAGKRTWFGPTSWGKIHWSCQMIQVNERLEEKRVRKITRKVSRSLV